LQTFDQVWPLSSLLKLQNSASYFLVFSTKHMNIIEAVMEVEDLESICLDAFALEVVGLAMD